jgi:transcriptional regulator with XRE-family HTH domain
MKDRIKQIIEREKLSSKEFANLCDIQVSNVSHLLSGRSKPSLDTIQKIMAAFPTLNTDWLMTGKEPMYKHEKLSQPGLFDLLPTEESNIQISEPQNHVNIAPRPSYSTENQIVTQNTIVKEVVKEIPPKKIQRIVVYYTDNTYDEFSK